MTTVSTSLNPVSDGSQTFESASGGTGRKPAANQSSSDQSLEFYDALTGDETKSDSGLVAFNEQDDRNLQRFLESLKQSPAASDRTESLEADQPDTVDGDTVPSARQVTLPKWADLKPSLVTLDRDTMPSTKTTKSARKLRWADDGSSTSSGSVGILSGPQDGAEGVEHLPDNAKAPANRGDRELSPSLESEVISNSNYPRGGEWTGDDTTSEVDTHMSSLLERLRRGDPWNRRAPATSIPPSATHRQAPASTTNAGETKSVLSSFRDWAASTASAWRWRGHTEAPPKTPQTAGNTFSNFSRPNRLRPTYKATTTAAATTRPTLSQTTYDYASSAYRHISNAVQSLYSSRVAPYIPAATQTLNSWAASVVSGAGDLARRAKDWAGQSQAISRARSHVGSTLWPRSVFSEGKKVTPERLEDVHGSHGELGTGADSSRATVPGSGSGTSRQTGGVRMRR
ncbi:hypothetical protein EHS25_008621 [Saitozyma podzolica]|uniref:Uncharacterized protein n=1 Tax=Saitozyma podzolica TaxID=1890683 RepID=A0A427YMA6_9TREE|nr:hypothetical protein EHS25_008621 [Saitozyma podzolica]